MYQDPNPNPTKVQQEAGNAERVLEESPNRRYAKVLSSNTDEPSPRKRRLQSRVQSNRQGGGLRGGLEHLPSTPI
jgi:hypothetical protein